MPRDGRWEMGYSAVPVAAVEHYTFFTVSCCIMVLIAFCTIHFFLFVIFHGRRHRLLILSVHTGTYHGAGSFLKVTGGISTFCY